VSSRHQPEAGADSEYMSAFDASCDYCGRTTYSGQLRQVRMAHSISFLCSKCYDRQAERYAAEMSLDYQDAEHERGKVA
jgi:hypothetical protein